MTNEAIRQYTILDSASQKMGCISTNLSTYEEILASWRFQTWNDVQFNGGELSAPYTQTVALRAVLDATIDKASAIGSLDLPVPSRDPNRQYITFEGDSYIVTGVVPGGDGRSKVLSVTIEPTSVSEKVIRKTNLEYFLTYLESVLVETLGKKSQSATVRKAISDDALYGGFLEDEEVEITSPNPQRVPMVKVSEASECSAHPHSSLHAAAQRTLTEVQHLLATLPSSKTTR